MLTFVTGCMCSKSHIRVYRVYVIFFFFFFFYYSRPFSTISIPPTLNLSHTPHSFHHLLTYTYRVNILLPSGYSHVFAYTLVLSPARTWDTFWGHTHCILCVCIYIYIYTCIYIYIAVFACPVYRYVVGWCGLILLASK